MNWDWLNWHNIGIAALAIVAAQLAKWLTSGAIVANYITAEVKKLQAAYDATNVGRVTAQFQAEQALWKLVEDEIPVVFGKLGDDMKAALTSGDFTKVDWKALGEDIWSGIRDKAQGGWVDYLAHSASSDGALLCADIVEAVFKKLHMNIQITNANPPVSVPVVTANAGPVVAVVTQAAQ